MYHIEVLPSSKDTATPGYAYVPDTGYDPSKAAIVPSSGSRKRARLAPSSSSFSNANDASSSSALTARQASKIAKHIADLDRDNHKDVQIAIPNKGKDVGARAGTGKGMTPGVRKILQSQKTWANYLADEEAALAVAAAAARERGGAESVASGSGGAAGGVNAGVGAPATPRPSIGAGRGRAKDPAKDGRRRKSTLKEVETVDEEEQVAQVQDQPTPMDIDSVAMPPPTLPLSLSSTVITSTVSARPISTAADDDNDPLMRSNLPPLPTAQELQALLAAPALSYSASRAAPSTSTAPPRRFCEMCGYWGRAKCMKCGARVCGIECRDAHEETRCLKFYA